MPLNKFADLAADSQNSLEDLIADPSRQDEFRSLWMRLLETPEERNDGIMIWFLQDGLVQSAKEIGDEGASMLWDAIADLTELSYRDLLSIPKNDRGIAYEKAQALILAATQREAFIRVGWATEALQAGIDSGQQLRAATQNATIADIKGFNMDIKNRMKQRRASL